ncbi:MAG: hypothetical protein LBR61_02565 [Synergistaceae bacterium]|nr:hypothetical protein [Synergistaceae bacterium]
MEATTQPKEPQMGLTFEKVWAMSLETDRQLRETDRQLQETARIVRKNSEEQKKRNEELERTVKELSKNMGDLGNRFGELAEHLVAPNIEEKFNALGFHFNGCASSFKINDEKGQFAAEIDILLENGESVVAVEVKSRPAGSDVKEHKQRLNVLRKYKDNVGDKRKIYGALAGAIMPSGVKTAALKAGFYVIVQTGDTVEIDVPEGFTPRDW